MTIKEILRKTYLDYKLSPLDAEILLSLALTKTKEYILAHPENKLTPAEIRIYSSFVERRYVGEPIAYITERKEFFGLDFIVNKNVLIPRPETELLVDAALRTIMNKKLKINNFIDLGTGSGNIIISVLKNIPSARKNKIKFYASDISESALAVAKKNSKAHKFDKDIFFRKSDLLGFALSKRTILKGNTLITANLPYLDKKWKNLLKSNESKGLKFEPKTALDGGYDGLDAYRKLAKHIQLLRIRNTESRIFVLSEIGHLQKDEMKNIFSFAGKINFLKDLAGRWRVAEIEIFC